jgi:polyisoprenoid-binding protein YceI
MNIVLSALGLASFVALGTPVPPTVPVHASLTDTVSTWIIDKNHSELTFRVRHMVSHVRGMFTEWEGAIEADPDDLENGSVAVSVLIASVNTQNERRDTDLRSPRFFDAEQFPTMTFTSTSIVANGNGIQVTGNLTIRDSTQSVILEGEYMGLQTDGGSTRMGFDLTTTINRQDFGVSFSRVLEGGGIWVGDEVEINIAIAAIRNDD